MSDLIENAVLSCIHERQSVGQLVAPAPSDSEVEQAVAAALTAPDHRRLKPWRFVVVKEDRLNEFGELTARSLLTDGETDVVLLERSKIQPLRAPMLIVCLMKYTPDPKVPHYEQVLTCGAAVQNLLLAFQSQGYSTIWRSGTIVESPAFKEEFECGEQDIIAGVIYVGTAGKMPPKREPLKVKDFLSEW